ncbi:MAG: aminoacyl-tRNA hydrolase [Patescibacteria group bacterium]
MFLIIGLGNPEKKYFTTRHNVGFLAVEAIAKLCDASWKNKTDLFAEIAETHHDNQKLILAKPQTYMNDSGKAVASLLHRYHIEPQHLIVILDDVDLPTGTLRTRTEGGAGGHNGLKSIIASIGTQQFLRVRMGVGANPPNIPLENWVLSPFPTEEAPHIPKIISTAAEIALNLAHGKLQAQTINTLPSSPLA